MGDYSGGMIALVPTAADAQRLAVEGGLPAEELHVTVMYLGETDDMSPNDKTAALDAAVYISDNFGALYADAFSVSVFNPQGEDPCIVLLLGGDGIAGIRATAQAQIGEIFPQRMPWAPHITLKYTEDFNIDPYLRLTGPVYFDRIRVAFGNSVIDMPLNQARSQSMTAAVNDRSWQSMPIAPRETKFSADDAISRGLQWANGSASKFNSLFLYRIPDGQPVNKESYRLPIADIIDGKPVLIPRAVFSAAVILSGGHGGLEGVVTNEDDRNDLKRVVTLIYDKLQAEYQDPRTVPPWFLGKTEQERDAEREAIGASLEEEMGSAIWDVEGLIASVNSAGWSSMPIADMSRTWDKSAATSRVWDWSGGDWRRYRRAFLWYDAERPEQKNSYKLPIADVIDGELTIVPHAVNAVAAVLGGARGGVDIPDSDMNSVARIVNRIQARWKSNESESAAMGGEDDDCGCTEQGECGCGDDNVSVYGDSVEAAAGPVYPPSSVFAHDYSNSNSVQPFTVEASGRASGLLWMWNKCHAGIVNECVMAPRSATDYAYFHNGQVLTSDGKMVRVGKITMGTGHAGPNMKWIPAADHYDNTGTVAAIGRITETAKGGWFDGVIVSSLSDEQAQELRRSPISGDWRRVNGHLELVAALAVNTPGFPIVASINGEAQSLVAAGMIADIEGGHTHDDTPAERNMRSLVDELDDKIVALAAKGRARKWNRLMAAFDERGK